GFSESGKVEVDFILNILLFPCTCSGSTKCTKSVSIIYQQAERVFFLQFCYFFQFTLVSGHSENAFGNYQNTTCSLFFNQGFCSLQLLFAISYIVVFVNIAVSCGHSQTINNTSMAFCIVYHYVVPSEDNINQARHTLVSEIEKCCVFLPYKFSQFLFQSFMFITVTAHHTGTHWVGKSVLGSSISISLSYFGVVG